MSRIKEARLASGLSRPDVFRIVGIPVRTLEDWEAGKRKIPEWEENLIVEKLNSIKNEAEE